MYGGAWNTYTGLHSGLYPSSVDNDWEKTHSNIEASIKNWLNAGLNRNQHGVHAPVTGVGPGEDGGFLRYSE
ncbi:hypothetical protein NQ314_004893, partial [Rhamnusium bicolor]